jgi:hypothetical protein
MITVNLPDLLITAAAVVAALGVILRPLTKFAKTYDAVVKAMQSLLLDRINHMCRHFVGLGSIDDFTKRSSEDLYEQYKALGGNGYADELIADIRELPATEGGRRK